MAVVTQQDLEDAQLDCQTIEDVVNGSATIGGDGLVHPRLGGNIRTLAKIEVDAQAAVDAILEDLENSDLSTELYNAIKDDLGDNPNGDGVAPTVFENLATLNGIQDIIVPAVFENSKFPLLVNALGQMLVWLDLAKNRVTGVGMPEQELVAKPFSISDDAGVSPAYLGWDGVLHNPAKGKSPKVYTKAVDVGAGDVQQIFMANGSTARQLTMLLQDAHAPEIIQEGVASYALEDGKLGTIGFAENDLPANSNNIDYHPYYGQSLSIGSNGGTGLGFQSAEPLINDAPSTRVLTFNGGMKVGHDGNAVGSGNITSFVSAVEESSRADAGGFVENDIGAVNMGFSLVNYQAKKILVSTCGFGGQDYLNLKKGTAQYAKLMELVEAGYDLAVASSLTFIVPCLHWVQGEANSADSAATYQGYLAELQTDFDTDVKAITGQTQNVHVFLQQINHMTNGTTVFTPAQGQLAAAIANPTLIHMVAPQYIMLFNDNYHPLREEYLFMGSHRAKVARRVIYENKPWDCVRPLSATRTGKRCVVKFHVPVRPLVLDDTFVTNPDTSTNKYGVVFSDSTSSAKVVTVKVVSPDELEIILDKIPTGTSPTLGFAYYNTGNITQGRTNGLRTCIRDSDNEGCPATGRPLHNYCVSSTISVA